MLSVVLLRDLIQGIARDHEALDPDIFDLGRIDAALNEHIARRVNDWESLGLLATFGQWHRRYGPPKQQTAVIVAARHIG